jgi:hypothetical protein
MYSGVYRFRLDYDVVASYSLQALKGYAPGWCSPILISQTPLIYELYIDRSDANPDIRPGKKIGTFELRRRPSGECEIVFTAVAFPTKRDWTEAEKAELSAVSDDERIDRILEIDRAINAEAEAELRKLKEHFDNVVQVYFRRLEDWDVRPEALEPTESEYSKSAVADPNENAAQLQPTEPEAPKQKGRYRLTDNEIKERKKVIQIAMRLKRESTGKTWKEVAVEMGIPERTLRDWRHNPLYR